MTRQAWPAGGGAVTGPVTVTVGRDRHRHGPPGRAARAGLIENFHNGTNARDSESCTWLTELDNSHEYVTETLVYYVTLPLRGSVQPTLVQLLPVHMPPPIQVIGTPHTSGDREPGSDTEAIST